MAGTVEVGEDRGNREGNRNSRLNRGKTVFFDAMSRISEGRAETQF